MTKLTNISPGPRGLHTVSGLVFVDPYQVWEGEIEAKAADAAIATGWFAKGERKFLGDEGGSEEVVGLKLAISERDQQIADLRQKLEAAENVAAERDAELAKLKSAKPDESAKTPAEVLAMATNPDVQFMSFKAAATKLLGDKTPSKKDEIVAALEELATQP